MNHSRFMKIQNICQLFCPTCFIGLSLYRSVVKKTKKEGDGVVAIAFFMELQRSSTTGRRR